MNSPLKRVPILILAVILLAGTMTSSGVHAQEPVIQNGTISPATTDATDATRKYINYQGQLFDPNNNSQPLGGATYTFKFTMYRDENGTQPLWSEQTTLTTNPDGTFNWMLGQLVGLSDSTFDGEEIFLGVSINGQEQRPLQIISYVPYAWWSRNSDKLSGYGASDFTRIVAGGFIDGNCNKVSGNSGWSSYRDLVAGAYVCIVDISGVNYNHRSFSSQVTPSCASPVFVGTGSSEGDMVIDVWDRYGNRSQCELSFAVFQP